MIPTDSVSSEYESQLSEIKDFPGMTKDQLYDLALNWVTRSYNSANDVIQLKDKENGQIICRGIGKWPMDLGIKRGFRYTMIIDIKDEKLRTRFENVTSERIGDTAGPNMSMQWKHV